MLGLGANKGLHGVGRRDSPNSPRSSPKDAIRQLDDFKGKKLRIFASEFQSASFKRLGATPVAMSPGNVVAALQQGALDASVAGIQLLSGLHFFDAAKYLTLTKTTSSKSARNGTTRCRPTCSRSSTATPPRPRSTLDTPRAQEIEDASNQGLDGRRRRIRQPAGQRTSGNDQDESGSVGTDISKDKPPLAEAFKIVSDAAQRKSRHLVAHALHAARSAKPAGVCCFIFCKFNFDT